MKKRTMRAVKATIKALYYVLTIAWLVWIMWSWADIVADNADEHPIHSEYNFFLVWNKE